MKERRNAPPALADDLMFSLITVGRAMEERLEHAIDQIGLSMPKYGLLNHLVESGEALTLGQCADRMTCVRSNMTQLMDRLEAEGPVKRVEDPSDRRAVRASVTPLGLERHAAGARVIKKVKKDFAKTLAGIDQAALQRALQAMK